MMTHDRNRASTRSHPKLARLKYFLTAIGQSLIPYHCYFCDGDTDKGSWVCQGCYADLPWNTHRCHRCALPLASPFSKLVCSECLSSPPSFNRAICVFRYETPIDRAIQLLKYHQKRYFATVLADMLVTTIQNQYDPHSYPEILIPVPIHQSKRKQRGFNQSQLIANRLGKALHIPADPQLLIKSKATTSQAGLNKAQRMRNLQGSFLMQSSLQNKHVALIDDVMTTLATSELLSRMLYQAGAKKVDIWSLARTAKLH